MTTTSFSIRRWLLRLLLGAGFAVLAMLALAVIFIAVPLTRRLLVVSLAEWVLGARLESLAVDLDLQPNLRWIFTLLIVLPVGFGLARAVMASRFSSALRGLALAAGTLLLVGVAVWWNTRHFNFDAKGRPVVYLSFRRDGAHKSYSPGIDRVTGRAKYQATVDRVLWLSDLARQPVRQVDPAVETNWFDANSGEPNLWYVEVGTNEWRFFNRPHFHQQLRVEVLPITPELMARWQAGHDHQVAEAEALQRQHEAEAKAAAEREHQRQESAQREHEAALARAKLEEARRNAEQNAREAAAEVARRQRLHEAAEALTPMSQLPASAASSQDHAAPTFAWQTPQSPTRPVAYAPTVQPPYSYVPSAALVPSPRPWTAWVPVGSYGYGAPTVAAPRFQTSPYYRTYSCGASIQIFANPSVSRRYSYGYHAHR